MKFFIPIMCTKLKAYNHQKLFSLTFYYSLTNKKKLRKCSLIIPQNKREHSIWLLKLIYEAYRKYIIPGDNLENSMPLALKRQDK